MRWTETKLSRGRSFPLGEQSSICKRLRVSWVGYAIIQFPHRRDGGARGGLDPSVAGKLLTEAACDTAVPADLNPTSRLLARPAAIKRHHRFTILHYRRTIL